MFISFKGKKHRFTLSTGEDDADATEAADTERAMDYVQLLSGQANEAPATPTNYEILDVGAYRYEEEEEQLKPRKTAGSFGLAPPKRG
jgi:hypothetical protein